MRILYISQFYEPENIASAFRATEHSRIWSSNGAEVTILTGYPNYPTGKVFDGYQVQLLHEEHMGGVKVLRSKLIAKSNTSFVNRIQNGLSFLWYGLKNLFLNRDAIKGPYDIVFATSGTIFAGYLGYRYAKKLHLPFVIEYRDLTYVQLIATGSLERSIKVKCVKWLELMMARKASKVVVLTASFKKTLVEDGIKDSKIVVVPNGADIVDIEPIDHRGLKLGYFGTMGLSQVIPETIDTLCVLKTLVPDFEYILIGEGASRKLVEEAVEAEGAGFVRLFHGMSKDELEPYYAELDMSVVSLKKAEAFAGTIPSKIFQSWARGIPVLFYGPDGEAASMIRDYGLGIVLCGDESENRQVLVDFFADDKWRDRLRNMKVQAKVIMAKYYTRVYLAKGLLNELEMICAGQGEAGND